MNPSTIDNITTVTMPKEVKQKSGLIIGLNAGHSTSSAPTLSLSTATNRYDCEKIE